MEDSSISDTNIVLNRYNEIFDTLLCLDLEGRLIVKLPGCTVRIFSDGDLIGVIPNDTEKKSSYFSSSKIQDIKTKIKEYSSSTSSTH